MTQARAVLFGCGPIGCGVARYARQRRDISLVGAIDADPRLVGRDLGEVAEAGEPFDIAISADANATLSEARPDVVFLTTVSSLKLIQPQVQACLAAGANVVSTCEELAFPNRRDPRLAAEIDQAARARNVTVLATGVNPGFLMDAWPLFMTAVCQRVDRVRAVRVQNAASRRGPFQRKIGAGRSLDEFHRLVAAGTLKHVGLPESIDMIASGLGWELDEVKESIEPVVATERVETDFVVVEPGQAAGVRQIGRGFRAGEERITLEFEASVGAPESYDAVYITGLPDLEVVIRGGTHGDLATAAIVVNSVPRVLKAPPGLLTMKDMPIVAARGQQ